MKQCGGWGIPIRPSASESWELGKSPGEQAAGSEADAIHATSSPGRKSRQRGVPRQYDRKQDAKVASAWKTRGYKTYAQLARQFGMKPADIKKAIDRDRQRRKSPRNNSSQ